MLVYAQSVDEVLTAYFDAWNEADSTKRESLLRRSLSEDAELIDPSGRWQGIAGLSDRIGRYHEAAPGTRVIPGSGVDSHHDLERYVWHIVGPTGDPVMEGIDVAERDRDGHLVRILMFHGPFPPPE